jgi:hypothetical protein
LFPGKNDPSGSKHDAVNCVVTLNKSIPNAQNIDAHVKVFDVDDPTHFDNSVDSNDKTDSSGDKVFRGGDNRGASPGFSPTGLTTVTVSDGKKVKQEYTADQLKPGNNIKVLVSVNKDLVSDAEVDSSLENGENGKRSFYMAATPKAKPKQGNSSPLLSVWRKLHVERDSMKDPGVSGPLGTDDPDPGDIGNPAIGWLTSSLEPIYVAVKDDLGANDTNDNAGFVRHLQDADAPIPGNNVRDVDSEDVFWVTQVMGVYDPYEDEDFDPNSGDVKMGLAPGAVSANPNGSDGPCNVYTEAIRDVTTNHGPATTENKLLRRIVTHEVGHRLGLGHTGGVMDASTNLTGPDGDNRYTLDQKDKIRDIPAAKPE